MLVAIGSRNPVKLAAARTGFAAIWPEAGWNFESVDVSSGVSSQPMSNAESIRGARTRVTTSRKLADADYGVGIESDHPIRCLGVAGSTRGDVTGGNVAEFLKYLPGLSLDLESGEAISVSVAVAASRRPARTSCAAAWNRL